MLLLQLMRADAVALIHRIEDRPVHLGRATSNDLILADPMVSEHHAVVWARGGRCWVRDLGSSNGTFVNGQRLAAPHALADGDHVTLGSTQLRLATSAVETDPDPLRVLEDRATGACLPLLGGRIHAGSAPDCDLILPQAPERLFTLLVHGDDLWLVTDEGEAEVELDQTFEVHGRQFVVRRRTTTEPSTVVPRPPGAEPRVRIEARLDSPTGPTATITDLDSGRSHAVDSENRAILLFLLARALRDDLDAGAPPADAGWRPDDDLMRGVWGRGARDNQLNVLLHRLRGELQEAGLDPWFLDKKRRFTRVRASELAVTGAP